MKIVCAWCHKVLAPGDESGDHVSHGICPDCRGWFFGQRRVPLAELLNQFDVPVMAIDAHGATMHVNLAVTAAIGGNAEEITGRLVGSVNECIQAHGREDCGCSFHCARCPVREAVAATHRDGRPRRGVEVEKNVGAGNGRAVRFTISTEKAGGIVLLMIDELTTPAPAFGAPV